MKYKWIRLHGYAGIYNGMNLTEIDIDFTKAKTNKIIIRGSNGSGKSTLMNAISLLPDSNDKFMPSMEARKVICINNNINDYIITYIHPVNNNGDRGTTKGYIGILLPDGTTKELNPNGNISSCKDLVFELFGLDNNFVSLSNLSSENRGLVDSRPADRKKLLVSILDTLELYNGIYKTFSKKTAAYKQLINSITYKLDSLGNKPAIEAKLQNIESRLNKLYEERSTTIEAIAAVKIKLNEYLDILKQNNYDSIVEELKALRIHNRNIENSISNKLASYGIESADKIEVFIAYLAQQISVNEVEIDMINKDLHNSLADREREAANLQAKQKKFESLQSTVDYTELKEAMESTRNTVQSLEEVFYRMGLNNINLITKDEFDSAMEALHNLKEAAIAMLATNHFEIEYYLDHELEITDMINHAQQYRRELDNAVAKYHKFDSLHDNYLSNAKIIGILTDRPSECKIDTCPFISTALEVAREYSPDKMDALEKEMAETNDYIMSLNQKLDDIARFTEVRNKINDIRRELNSKMRFISKLPVRKDFAETFIDRIIALDHFDDITALYAYVDCGNMLEEYKVQKAQLDKYTAEYQVYAAKQDIIESMITDIANLNEKINAIGVKIDEYSSKYLSLQDTTEDLRKSKEAVEKILTLKKEEYDPSKAREDDLLNIKAAIDANTSEIGDLQSKLDALNANLGSVDNDIKGLSDEREAAKHMLLLIEDYKLELEKYNTEYTKIDRIRYYSSPSTGIQTIFMQLYMNKIITTANSLLTLLFDGEFVLQPFIINENEFRIPCLGNGLLHDDISSMSNAQKCMISMILSFSILHQSSSIYNVIMLDEIDGPLDTSNRVYFLDLLNNIMGMMHCEQCFIISHNNELNTSECDLILLKNNTSETYQGNVIWQY